MTVETRRRRQEHARVSIVTQARVADERAYRSLKKDEPTPARRAGDTSQWTDAAKGLQRREQGDGGAEFTS